MQKITKLMFSLQNWRQNHPYLALTAGLMLFSLVILFTAYQFGFAESEPNAYKSYFEKPNWFLFMFFWPIVIPFYYLTWNEFIEAWKDLFANGCITAKGEKPSQSQLQGFIQNLNLTKHRILMLAFILASIAIYLDTKELRALYFDIPEKQQKIKVYKATVESSQTYYFLSKVKKGDLYENSEIGTVDDDFLVSRQDLKNETLHLEDTTWTELWLYTNDFKTQNALFVFLAYIQQYVIILFGFAALLNIWFHLYIFAFFHLLKFVKENYLNLQLDPYSNVHEFGLERWNHALNTIYWVLVPTLAIPIISSTFQDASRYDTGQIMIRWLVPLLFLSPMVFTIIARQKKVTQLWENIRNSDIEKAKIFHQQLLWPLDRNWASKLGILLSFLLLGYLLNDIFSKIGMNKVIF